MHKQAGRQTHTHLHVHMPAIMQTHASETCKKEKEKSTTLNIKVMRNIYNRDTCGLPHDSYAAHTPAHTSCKGVWKKSEKHKRDGKACSGFSTNTSTFIRNCLACTHTHTNSLWRPSQESDGWKTDVLQCWDIRFRFLTDTVESIHKHRR